MRRVERDPSTPSAGDVLLVPPMDPFASALAAAIFRSLGYDARVLEENARTLALGMQHTGGGECSPCPSTLGALIAAVRDQDLDPSRVVFFMPTTCGPCRFGQYARLAESVFEKLGWERIRIMSPSAENAYAGLDARTRLTLWRGMLVSDLLRKWLLRVRPYEIEPGHTDRVVGRHLALLEQAFETRALHRLPRLLDCAAEEIAAIPRRLAARPLVGVVGEIYVRFSPFLNGDVCRRIEELGGEAALATMSEWVLYTNHVQRLQARTLGLRGWRMQLKAWAEARFIFEYWERRMARHGGPLLRDRVEPSMADVLQAGGHFLPWAVRGEAILTLGRAFLFARRDGARAIVNTSPAFCMPGTVSAGIFPSIEKTLGIPVVCTFYDGSGDVNQALVPVMHYLCERHGEAPAGLVPA